MLGHWNDTKTKLFYYSLEEGEVKCLDKVEFGRKDSFVTGRYIYTHAESRDFHRVLIAIENQEGEIFDIVYMQYYFDRNEHNILVTLPH